MNSSSFKYARTKSHAAWYVRPSLAILILCLLITLVSTGRASWSYSWSTRTDQYGKPAGHFEATPFPIWETNTTYTITNDESPNGKTFNLGTLYFVDGAMVDDTGDGLSLATAKKYLKSAYNLAPTGNVTILIRGAHDAFNGIYSTNATDGVRLQYQLKAGAGDTNRWMISGYGQERPVIDAALYWDGSPGRDAAWDIFPGPATTNAFCTLQRLQIQNCYGDAVYIGRVGRTVDHYASIIDLFVTNCCALNTNIASGIFVLKGNSPVYVTDAQWFWAYHCTLAHSTDHLFKVGGPTGNSIVEWCVAYEAGYWDTLYAEAQFTPEGGGRSHYDMMPGVRGRTFDFPADYPQTMSNNVMRYCIGWKGLFGNVQIRNAVNFECHHNEIYQSPCWQQLNRTAHYSNPLAQLVVGASSASNPNEKVFNVRVHANYIHDALDTNASAFGVTALAPSNSVWFYNNVCWSNATEYGEIWMYPNTTYANSNRQVHCYNNTIVSSKGGNYPVLQFGRWNNGELRFTNNLVVQYGTKYVADWNNGGNGHDYNLYYYPNTTLGFTANAHEITGQDPLFETGGVIPNGFRIGVTSPARGAGLSLPDYVKMDVNGVARGSAWDIGAHHYVPLPTSNGVQPPKNLQRVGQ